MNAEELHQLKAARWLARTDLRWLCNNVMGMADVNEEIHGGLIDKLQKFPRPTAQQFEENDRLTGKEWQYTPIIPLKEFTHSKRTLILDFRGSLKTSINIIAHSLQWIINYPDITILIVQSNTDKAKLFLKELKAHFVGNPIFRKLFPEHVPQKKVFDWGTMEAFTTEARSRTSVKRESTVMTASIDKGVAGIHVDVIKFSDIVEENNSRDSVQTEAVYYNFNSMLNLLVSPSYWVDVEGTRYNYGDTYGQIIEKELEKPIDDRYWDFYINACYVKIKHDGPRTYGPEEIGLPFARDEAGDYISRWPERFTANDFKEMQRADPRIFSCQQLNDPAMGSGKAIFPVTEELPKFITKTNFLTHVNVVYRELMIDTAETANRRSDFSVVSVGAWDADGRLYIEQIYQGKWLPDELIKIIITAAKLYTPKYVNIEETAFVRGLRSSLGREMAKSGIYLPVRFIKRDNQTSKIERIQNTLQPWYVNGYIRFLDTILAKQELFQELREFPKGRHDDILDTLADFFQNKTYYGREADRPPDAETADVRKARLFLKASARDHAILTGAVDTPAELEGRHNIRPGLCGII